MRGTMTRTGTRKKGTRFPLRYLPNKLSKKDKKKQVNMLLKSRKLYKNKIYYTRQRVSSYKNKTSNHIENARKIYKVDKITPNNELSQKTGCSLSALRKIVKKGKVRIFHPVQDQTKPHNHGD